MVIAKLLFFMGVLKAIPHKVQLMHLHGNLYAVLRLNRSYMKKFYGGT